MRIHFKSSQIIHCFEKLYLRFLASQPYAPSMNLSSLYGDLSTSANNNSQQNHHRPSIIPSHVSSVKQPANTNLRSSRMPMAEIQVSIFEKQSIQSWHQFIRIRSPDSKFSEFEIRAKIVGRPARDSDFGGGGARFLKV